MSHSTVGVILRLIDEDLDYDLDDLVEGPLEPFDENMEVDEHEVDCWCIGYDARADASKIADERVPNREVEGQDQKWRDLYFSILATHEKAKSPDATCEDCHGTGLRMTTYNANSKWDWYSVGGRWENSLPNGDNIIKVSEILNDTTRRIPEVLPEHDPFYKFFKIEQQKRVEEYWSSPADLRDLWTPFALLTPDGEWLERGEMLMFAMVSNEKHAWDWQQIVFDTFTKYQDCYLVLVDVHI